MAVDTSKEKEKEFLKVSLEMTRGLREIYIARLEEPAGYASYYTERLRARVLELQRDELRFMEWISQI